MRSGSCYMPKCISFNLQYFVFVHFGEDTILWIASISGYDKETACSFHNKTNAIYCNGRNIYWKPVRYSLCIKLVPYILSVLGISTGNMALQFNPFILIVSVAVTVFSILLGMRKPIQIATKVTPVEATKYIECVSNGKGYKKKKGAFFWRMAFEQFKKDKKKTVVVLLSLAISLSVFYCLTTIISSQGERTVLPNYWNADFVVQNQTQTTENINSLKPAIEDSFVEK